MQVSALRLNRFDAEMEDRFRKDLTARVMPLGRLGAALGAVLFLGLAFWDHHLDPSAMDDTLPIRFGVGAIFLIALAFTFTTAGSRSVSPYMGLQVVVGLATPLLLTQLPNGFIAGVPGMLLPMSVVPIFSTALWHAGLALGALVILPNLVMVIDDASSFEIIEVNYWLISGVLVAGALTYLMYLDRRRAFAAQENLEIERLRSESLLLNILPADIADRLKDKTESTSDGFGTATVLFADIAGFTDFAEKLQPDELVAFLNELVGEFDDIASTTGIEKIKTIGDAYMAVAGVPVPRSDHAAVGVETGIAMLDAFRALCARRNIDLGLRIGIHSGPLVGGVIGKRKFSYDVWGDTVNVASRMESAGVAGRVQISDATRALLPAAISVEPRGEVELKGHTNIETYLVVS